MSEPLSIVDVRNWVVTRSQGLRSNLDDFVGSDRIMTMNFKADDSGRTLLQMTYWLATQTVALEPTASGFTVLGAADDTTDVLSVLPRAMDERTKRASIVGNLLEPGTQIELEMQQNSFSVLLQCPDRPGTHLNACAWSELFQTHDAFIVYAIAGFQPEVDEAADGWDRLAFLRNNETEQLTVTLVTSGWAKEFEVSWRGNVFEILRRVENGVQDWMNRDHPRPPACIRNPSKSATSSPSRWMTTTRSSSETRPKGGGRR